MKWIKKNDSINTIAGVIEANTGLSIEELENPPENPYLTGLSECVSVVKRCISEGMEIHIVGDYDCDGDTSSTILKLGIEEYTGKHVSVRLPHRFSEGYGLSVKIIDEIDSGLVITVDNGIAAVEAVKTAKEKGLTVVIIDHHVIRDDGIIPSADAIMDPHAIPGSEYDGYCGAGLAYRFIMELNPETKLKEKLVALAGIGTVADVMPLTGDNRRLVRASLEAVGNRKVTAGLRALLDAAGISAHPTESNFGFKLGPCFNAAGRLEDAGAEKVVNCISYDPDEYEAFMNQEGMMADALELVNLNKTRQKMVHEGMIYINEIMGKMDEIPNPIILYDKSFHEGLVGIFAGKLAEKYRRTAIVFTDSATHGIIKGSGRSYGEVNLKEELDKVSDLFTGYGGHKGAAGMSLPLDNLSLLQEKMGDNLKEVKTEDLSELQYDLECSTEDIQSICEELRQYAPFGEACPPVSFLIKNFNAIPKGSSYYEIMGDFKTHVKLYGNDFNLMLFDMAERFKDDGEPREMDVIGYLSVEWFMNKPTYTVEVIDYKKKENKKTEAFSKLQDSFNFI